MDSRYELVNYLKEFIEFRNNYKFDYKEIIEGIHKNGKIKY